MSKSSNNVLAKLEDDMFAKVPGTLNGRPVMVYHDGEGYRAIYSDETPADPRAVEIVELTREEAIDAIQGADSLPEKCCAPRCDNDLHERSVPFCKAHWIQLPAELRNSLWQEWTPDKQSPSWYLYFGSAVCFLEGIRLSTIPPTSAEGSR